MLRHVLVGSSINSVQYCRMVSEIGPDVNDVELQSAGMLMYTGFHAKPQIGTFL